MTLGVIAAALWVGFWMLVFREPWGEVERASFVLTVVTLGSMVGLIWWEIFLGGELRKRAARGHPRARPESPPA
jgi:hypothetical protein